MKKKTKNTLFIVGGVVLLAMLMGMVLNLYGVFDPKELNPKNLVSITAIGEEDYGTLQSGKTGHGVTVEVGDLGEIKVRGKATVDLPWVVAEGIELTPGKTYTFTAGVESATVEGYHIRLKNGSQVVYADFGSNTFTAEEGTYTLEIFVAEDTRVNATFYPVLVEGAEAGSFYAD